jgi:methylenetetrahydrofolate dehydrogenase (NADP+)/methenyltetrahydrofolate cyclohydrolase
MTAQIIDGESIGAEIRADVARRVEALKANGINPGLAAILVGEDPGSVQYVGMKRADCAEVGILSETFDLPATASEEEVLELMAALNADERFHAILPQLPMPKQVNETRILDAMRREKDADGLHPTNLGKVLRGDLDGAIPCTPNGVMELLRRSGNSPAGKHAVVVGRSTLVGRPLAVLLSNKAEGANATVTICHTGTKDLASHTRQADILVMAAGRANMLTADMVKPGAVVIDVGTNRIDAPERKRGWRIVGDVDFAGVSEVASYITKVPGGVGPLTRAMLMVNTVKAAEAAGQS